jgi:predicted enzyme related to lactoylglutathione lyase
VTHWIPLSRQAARRILAATMLGLACCGMSGTSRAALADVSATSATGVAVGPQYDSTHVYVSAADFDRCVSSLLATFGGSATRKGTATVTPMPSSTYSQLVLTPAGSFSVFGFQTPVPFPFGAERNGYLVTDLDEGVRAARASGADVVVAPFPDKIGRDAIIQWPGGVFMQLYWHTTAPHYPALATVPENRVYASPDAADRFIKAFVGFSGGSVVSDDAAAPGIEIGRPSDTYRRVRIESPFGKMAVLVTDGHLPYPYGRETTGYDVSNLAETLERAKSAGATVLVPLFATVNRFSAVVEFPGGFIAELHSARPL